VVGAAVVVVGAAVVDDEVVGAGVVVEVDVEVTVVVVVVHGTRGDTQSTTRVDGNGGS